jgi:hypothetical protein
MSKILKVFLVCDKSLTLLQQDIRLGNNENTTDTLVFQY